MNEREEICRMRAWVGTTGGWPGGSGRWGEPPGFAKNSALHLTCFPPPIFLVMPFHLRLRFLSGLLWVVLHGISSFPFNNADIHAILLIKRVHCAGHYACLQGPHRGETTTLSWSRGSQLSQSLNSLGRRASAGGELRAGARGGRGLGRLGGGLIGLTAGGTRRC